MRIVAFVTDLMDRSRLTTALSDVEFATDVNREIGSADVVVVDLARYATAVGSLRLAAPDARIVAYGPHVDDEAMARARSDGADVVVPRSRFFRDPAAALASIE